MQLLHRQVTLEDLRELEPSVGRSLQSLLDHEEKEGEKVILQSSHFSFALLCLPFGSELPKKLYSRVNWISVYWSKESNTTNRAISFSGGGCVLAHIRNQSGDIRWGEPRASEGRWREGVGHACESAGVCGPLRGLHTEQVLQGAVRCLLSRCASTNSLNPYAWISFAPNWANL